EPFQLMVRAEKEGLRQVRAAVSSLRGPGGASLPPANLYREEYLDIKIPSSIEGHAGRWPDALVPDVDAYVGERRRAFPFDVPPGEGRALWIDLRVPEDAPPGLYRGAAIVQAAGRPPAWVAIELTVHRFALPRSSSLPVTFGFAGPALERGHPGLS